MIMDWYKITIRYLVIGTIGSVVIVAGTYFLALYQVDIPLEGDELLAHIDQSRETVVGLVQDYLTPEDTPPSNANGRTTPSNINTAQPSPTSPPGTRVSTAVMPTRRWGVVKNTDTKTFNRAGKYLRPVEAGTLVDIVDIKSTKAGQLALCKVHYQGREIPDILILTSDLDIQPGPLAQADEREKSLRVQYANLLKSISARKKELVAQARSRNPHAAEYDKAKNAYLAFARRAEDLTKKRDEATGATKTEYADKLRMMKGEAIPLRQAYEQSKLKYREWDQQHSGDQPPPNDSTLTSLNRQLAGIENDLRAMERR